MHKGVFTPENSAMLLIDHQIGTMAWTHSHDINLVKQNALKLARIAKAANIPTILTSSMEDQIQGPLLPELEAILPEAFEARGCRPRKLEETPCSTSTVERSQSRARSYRKGKAYFRPLPMTILPHGVNQTSCCSRWILRRRSTEVACSVGTKGAAPRDAGLNLSSLVGLGVISSNTSRSPHGVIVLVNIHVKALGSAS